MKYNQNFLRYEFKYLLNNSISKNILQDAKNFMYLDDFAKKNDKGYFVRSLYYDNSSYDNFFEKVDGMQLRRKFRIRTYSNTLKKDNTFLELKGRQNDRILKKRTIINEEDIESFENLKNLEKLKIKYKNNNIINNFIFEVYRKKICPKILVDYYRVPLINKFGLYFRLTFDSNLVTSKSTTLFQDKENFPVKYKPGNTILEVKFERSIPTWFHKIIQTYNLNRKSISKFVLGVVNCRIQNETSD